MCIEPRKQLLQKGAHNKSFQHNMVAKTFFECIRGHLEQKRDSVASVAAMYIAISRQYPTLGPA